MKFKEPIGTLQRQVKQWRQDKKAMQDALSPKNNGMPLGDARKFYKEAIVNCNEMINIYREAIAKLKSTK